MWLVEVMWIGVGWGENCREPRDCLVGLESREVCCRGLALGGVGWVRLKAVIRLPFVSLSRNIPVQKTSQV